MRPHKPTQVLLKGIFEATEVKTPTTFIILDEELQPELSAVEQEQLLVSLKEDDSGIELTGDAKVAKGRFDKGMTWLKRLQTFAAAFFNLYANDDGITGIEFRKFTGCLFCVDLLNDIHRSVLSILSRFRALTIYFNSWRNSFNNNCASSSNSLPSNRSGRRSHVRPNDCFLRQRRIASWSPESKTSGTTFPPAFSGRVKCG